MCWMSLLSVCTETSYADDFEDSHSSASSKKSSGSSSSSSSDSESETETSARKDEGRIRVFV